MQNRINSKKNEVKNPDFEWVTEIYKDNEKAVINFSAFLDIPDNDGNINIHKVNLILTDEGTKPMFNVYKSEYNNFMNDPLIADNFKVAIMKILAKDNAISNIEVLTDIFKQGCAYLLKNKLCKEELAYIATLEFTTEKIFNYVNKNRDKLAAIKLKFQLPEGCMIKVNSEEKNSISLIMNCNVQTFISTNNGMQSLRQKYTDCDWDYENSTFFNCETIPFVERLKLLAYEESDIFNYLLGLEDHVQYTCNCEDNDFMSLLNVIILENIVYPYLDSKDEQSETTAETATESIDETDTKIYNWIKADYRPLCALVDDFLKMEEADTNKSEVAKSAVAKLESAVESEVKENYSFIKPDEHKYTCPHDTTDLILQSNASIPYYICPKCRYTIAQHIVENEETESQETSHETCEDDISCPFCGSKNIVEEVCDYKFWGTPYKMLSCKDCDKGLGIISFDVSDLS